jgi:hypothetical protein
MRYQFTPEQKLWSNIALACHIVLIIFMLLAVSGVAK